MLLFLMCFCRTVWRCKVLTSTSLAGCVQVISLMPPPSQNVCILVSLAAWWGLHIAQHVEVWHRAFIKQYPNQRLICWEGIWLYVWWPLARGLKLYTFLALGVWNFSEDWTDELSLCFFSHFDPAHTAVIPLSRFMHKKSSPFCGISTFRASF